MTIPTRGSTAMDIARIAEILVSCLGNEGEDGVETVDVWHEVKLRIEKVHEHAAEMAELLKEWPRESWGQPVPALGEEISYTTAGAVLGDQGRALMLFAFGKLLGWWTVMEPCSMLGLEKDDPLAKDMAGMGLISITGYKPVEANA